MARLKKPIDYIRNLQSNHETRKLGESLHSQYVRWTGSLRLEDFLCFVQIIQNNKNRIGVPSSLVSFAPTSLKNSSIT